MNDRMSAGDSIEAENANWSFGGDVAEKFDDHVSKSVPMYREGHTLVTELSDFFLSEGSTAYEVGCSTGTLSCMIAERNKSKRIKMVGIDCEEGMVKIARERANDVPGVSILCENVMDVEFEPADLIVAYYAVQFVKPKNRQILFDRMYKALNWGGALILFEKVRAPDARFQDISSAIYTDFKLKNGYDPKEIIAKSRSLKGVLEPFSTQGNIDLMKRAGFSDITSVMKYVCFEGFLAIK